MKNKLCATCIDTILNMYGSLVWSYNEGFGHTFLSIWSGFSRKIAIFGALDAWIGAWNWQKWPQAILSHQLGCDMAHQALSRWTGLAWSHPGPFGPDLAKK